MMKRSRVIGALASLGALAAYAAQAGAQVPTREKLRVAFPTLDSTSEVMFASDMGFFEKAGLDVEMMPLVNGAAIAAGVASGTIDIGLGNTLTVMTAYKKGLPFTIVGPGAMNVSNAPSNVLLVSKASTIGSARDLNGKTIGVSPLRAIGEVAINAWVDKNGGDSTTIKYVEVPFSQAEAMLVSTRADAAFSSEPFITQSRANTRILANPFSVIGENWLITAFFAARPWAQAHAASIARFTAVIRETAKWANKNPDLSAPILAKYAKLDVAIVKQTIRSRFAATLMPAQLQPVIDASARYKLLDAPFRADELIFQPT